MRQGSSSLLLLLLFAATPLLAQDVYRCVDKSGHVSLLSAPCAPGQRLTRKTYAEPAQHRPDIAARNARVAAEMDARNRALARQGRSNASGAARRSASRQANSSCEAAKTRRDDALRKAGLRRDFDMLRALDDAVYRACR